MSFNYFFLALRISAVALVFVSGSLWLACPVKIPSGLYGAWAVQSTFQQADWSVGLTGWTMTLLMLTVIGAMTRAGIFEAGLSGCVFSSRYCRVKGTLIRSLSVFSEHAYFCADSQETSAQGQRPELSTEQIVSTSGTFLSFRMDENASQETYKAHNSEKNFGSDREFFKEITGQTYRKDSCADGINAFRNEFPSGVVDNCLHRLNNIIREWGCQEQCLNGART